MKTVYLDAETRLADAYDYIRGHYFHDLVTCRVCIAIPLFIPASSIGKQTLNHLCHISSEVPAAQYDGHEHVVRFHPVLFHSGVPRYVLRYLMYHGLAHELLPPLAGEDIHHEAFIVKENIAPYRHEASVWLLVNGFPVMTLPADAVTTSRASA